MTEIKMSSLPWWRTDTYDDDVAIPTSLRVEPAGPQGIALVRVWPDGRTDQGWGLNPSSGGGDGFWERYNRGEFNERRVVYGFERDKWAFAFVMRSMQLVCLDIDGKNGGLEHAKKLGMLPATLAETSKSGDGYHLFYRYAEPWTDLVGYGELSDRIGIEQGVDFRATGCVFHYSQQRWNHRAIADAPPHLIESIKARHQKQAATTARILTVLSDGDPLEILMMHDQILTDLRKPIKAGKRNNTLFAIGSQMVQSQMPDWENLLAERAIQVGLDNAEAEKLVRNVRQYGLTNQPPTP